MKITCAFASILLLLSLSFCVYSQGKNKSDKTSQAEPKLGEIKANLMVVDSNDKFVDDVQQDKIKIFEDGAEQKITYFVKKDPVVSVGLVVDNSGSLRTQIESVLYAGKTIATNLGPNDEAFVVRFISSDKIEILQDLTSEKTELIRAFESMYVEGGHSAIVDALYVSAQKLMTRERDAVKNRYAIVLITDGEDRASYYDSKQLFDIVSKSNLQIFPLTLTGELSDKRNPDTGVRNAKTNAEKLANTLALRTGGSAHILSQKFTEAELLVKLKAIMIELRSQFVIGYTPSNQRSDGLVRRLRVEIADGPNGEKRRGIIRDSFTTPKE